MSSVSETAPKSARIEGIDVARGLASAIMIQGHAYDGWVAEEHKSSAAYLFTRLLGTLPLPAFLILAGAAIALRIRAAAERGERPEIVRRALLTRGLTVVGVGYALNVVSAWMDGAEGFETYARADVLGVIGLSIITLGWLGVRGAGTIDLGVLDRVALALAVIPILVCPWLTPLGATIDGPLRFLVAPFLDVPGLTRMPYVPLAAWAGVGVLVTTFLTRFNQGARSIAGAPDRVLALTLLVAVLVAVGGARLTAAWVEASGEPLSRAHPAVITNAIELAARGVIVLATGALLTPRLPERVKRILLRLGRGSLVAYVFHLPFSYGALGLLVRGRLDMFEATVLVLALEIASYLAVLAWAAWTERRGRATSAAA